MFTSESLKGNVYVQIESPIGVVTFHRFDDGWRHSVFGYIMTEATVLETINNPAYKAEVRGFDPCGMNDWL